VYFFRKLLNLPCCAGSITFLGKIPLEDFGLVSLRQYIPIEKVGGPIHFHIIGSQPEFISLYSECCQLFDKILEFNGEQKEKFMSLIRFLGDGTPIKKYVFLQTIMNKLYLLYTAKDFQNDKLLQDILNLFMNNIKELNIFFPGNSSQIVLGMLSNFNGNSYFSLKQIENIQDLNRKLITVHGINVFMSFCMHQSCLSSPFFSEGEITFHGTIPESIASKQGYYFPSVPEDEINWVNYLKGLRELDFYTINKKFRYNLPMNRLVKCSTNCKFVYAIGDCGQPISEIFPLLHAIFAIQE